MNPVFHVLCEEGPKEGDFARADVQLRHERHDVGNEFLALVQELRDLPLLPFLVSVDFVTITINVSVNRLLVVCEPFTANCAPHLTLAHD